jgi:hypothetical protein
MPTMNNSRHGGKLSVPLGRLRGRWGRKLPLSLNLWEMVMWKRMKMRKRGR